MSFSSTINFSDYINRAVAMLLDNGILRNATVADSLVTNVLAQEPPIDQSSNLSIAPYIYVSYSKNPIREQTYIGRDGLNTAGSKMYKIEFYCVCIDRGISRQNAQVKVQRIAEIVRDVFQKNLRMTNPADGSNPLCAENEVVSVPFVLRSSDPNLQAINVIVRPNVPVDLR
jgi:hypothetical protein